jgi:hypothetical protein
MPSYDINDLRNDLAGTIRDLRNPESGMTVEKAKVVSELAQTMINSAKAEVEMLRTVGRGRMSPTGFIPLEHQDTLDQQEHGAGQAQLPAPSKPKPHIRNPMGTAPRPAI